MPQSSSAAPSHYTPSTTRKMVDATLPLLVAAVLLPLVGQTFLAVTSGVDGSAAARVLGHMAAAAPGLLMALSMLSLRRVLVEYERGHFLSPAATTSFRWVGYWTISAMLVRVLAPLLLEAAALGQPVRRSGIDTFDVSLLLFAALVAMVGAAFESAAAAFKADSDEII